MSRKPRALHHVVRRHTPRALARARVLRKHAKKTGIVYFGHVDQHQDEHQEIRCITLSASHRDDHYSVGTFAGRDVSIVERADIIKVPGQKKITLQWLIVEIRLERATDYPHLFLVPQHSEATSAYPSFLLEAARLYAIPQSYSSHLSTELTSRYTLYTAAHTAATLPDVLPTPVVHTIATGLWPFAIELQGARLYVYSHVPTKVSQQTVETLVERAVLLANALDPLD